MRLENRDLCAEEICNVELKVTLTSAWTAKQNRSERRRQNEINRGTNNTVESKMSTVTYTKSYTEPLEGLYHTLFVISLSPWSRQDVANKDLGKDPLAHSESGNEPFHIRNYGYWGTDAKLVRFSGASRALREYGH